MTDFFDQISALSPKRLALLALELKERLDASDDRAREPIAIVGMGVRFPGADSPQVLAELLDAGVDVISEVPKDRWDIDAYFDPDPEVPGTMNTRYGGFLNAIDQFDPAHFGISPREAAGMDPQQRLVLEVAWEALENAGIAPDRLAGSQTGVFLGIATLDYASLMMQRGEGSLDLYSSSGGSHAVAAGRLSYILGLHGPAVAVDTACSSSLVAAHLACQSLRSGECETALAAGVNVICAPETTLMLSRARMMAPDGRCKTFDARADGFVRGEGCGVLVLRRLSVAQAAGDRILALIRGSAVNQDGRSSGLTAPNGPAQEAVIRAALTNAGVGASSVTYVEAHGTGTSLGDPIELRALGAVYGAGRDATRALITSSIKTNFGHLEAAAGVAGLIKTVLAFQRERIPAHLHLQTPTPHVDWATLGVRVPAPGGESWKRTTTPRLAGVSSFGFSGTNAHVILEEAPPSTDVTSTALLSGRHCVLPIAARTTGAVRAIAGSYADHMQAHAADLLGDICDAAASGRAQLVGSRAIVLATGREGAHEALARLAGTSGPPVSEKLATSIIVAADATTNESADVAFVFTGQGGAHVGMGRALFDSAPVFRESIARLDAPFRDATGVSLIGVLYGDEGHQFSRGDVSAAALVAFQIALAELWRSWGVEPAAVAGHSLGEYAAAVTASVLSEREALRLVATRGCAITALPSGVGAMVIIDARIATIEATLGRPIGAPNALEIAAINAPEQVVLSGPAADVEHARRALVARGIRVRGLDGISHAYHSAQLDALLSEYLNACQGVQYGVPSVDWVSCRTGAAQSAAEPVTAGYWVDQMRQPVEWRRTVETLAARGARVLIEIGPTAVLSGLSRASLEAAGIPAVLSLPSMRSGVDAWSTMLETLGRGWVHGMKVDWTHFRQGPGARIPLPTYPFQRERFWLPSAPRVRRVSGVRRHRELLGARLSGPVETYPIPIDADSPGVLRDHVVHGGPLFAGSAFVDVALLATARTPWRKEIELRDVRFLAPLEVGGNDREAVLSVEDRDDGTSIVTLSSSPLDGAVDAQWSRHARALVGPATTSANRPFLSPADLQRTLPEVLHHDALYAAFSERGITLGASVRCMRQLWRRDGEALSRLELDQSVPTTERRAALLDGALQTFGVASPQFGQHSSVQPTRVLARINTARFSGDVTEAAWCHAALTDTSGDVWHGALHLFDATGNVLASFEGLALVVPNSAVTAAATYQLTWEDCPLPAAVGLPSCSELADDASRNLVRLGTENRIAEYDTLVPILESTALRFACEAFASLDLSDSSAVLSDSELTEIVPQHHRLVRRLARKLEANREPVSLPDRATLARARHLGDGELLLLERCGAALANVLRGSEDPLQLLFPGGSFEALEGIYRD
ncbi:MAG: beta-ketoacyl synthase N-terminal-like domain-containing protein, partial [Gemmatimonadaceae bacterium]